MAQNEGLTDERVVKTLCGMCASHCGIDVELRGDMIVGITPMKEHPLRRLCVRALASPEVHYSYERLHYPLKKVNGDFKRISWDEALDFIATRLNYIKERYGPEALATFYGHSQFVKDPIGLVRLWAQAYGTSNICDAGSICAVNRMITGHVTFGGDPIPNIGRSKCFISWGTDDQNSQVPARHIWASMKERGVKIIVIDPRLTYEAKISDLHLRPRIGTDWALALALINVIISEKLYDKEFVDRWTVGFDKVAAAVADDYTPKKVEAITGVPANQIEECARMYATTKPASIGAGLPFDQTTQAFGVRRAQNILIALTGNVEVDGGNKLVPHAPSMLLRFAYDDPEYHKTHKPTFTADRYPLWEEWTNSPVTHLLADTILTEKPYPIKGFICQGGNPFRSFPNTNKLERALKELDFILVMDIFMTDFAEYADIVLPATIPLECDWAHSYEQAHLPLVSIANKAVAPPGECWSDSKFWIELAKRMGYGKAIPWKDKEDVLENICQSMGKTLKEMREELPGGYWYESKKTKAYEEEGFHTPSGKVELYSESLEKMGLPPLPVPYQEPAISPITRPELFKEYPLMCISASRVEEYEHTWARNIPSLRRRVPDPLVEIHPKDAEKNGIEGGQWCVIESPQGWIKMKAKITSDMMEGVVAMPHGWGGECNVNRLTSDEEPGPVVGAAQLRGFACRVKKIDE